MNPNVPDILRRIADQRRARLGEAARGTGELPLVMPGELLTSEDNALLAALSHRRGKALIAEVKMGSPRLGDLSSKVDPLAQARLYAAGGASALSVVVEPDFFFGSYELLAACRQASGLPTLAKDFVVHPLQLWWAKRAQADAVLLVAAILDVDELHFFAGMARRLGLVPLIELHSEDDRAKLDGAEWELVGVNNRDLKTFEVSLEHSIALAPRLPPAALKVAESGLKSRAEIDRLAEAGFDAFLVGESLLLAENKAALLAELVR